jgi:hypothetical protein
MLFERCLVVGAIFTVSAVTSARAGELRIVGATARDVRQTMQARKLMQDDPELAHFNIGVIVTDRVAVLWGPVPSAEVAFRAELCVRTMVELVQVRSELFVSELLEPIRAPLKIDIPPLFLPEHLPPKLPVEPRPVLGAPGLFTGQAKATKSQIGKRPDVESSHRSSQTEFGNQTKDEPKLALPTLGLPQADESAKKLPDPIAPTVAERELEAVVRTFLQSKATYGSVQFAVKERRVYLKAADQDSDALHEAARGIARLPNVEGVILPDKSSPR